VAVDIDEVLGSFVQRLNAVRCRHSNTSHRTHARLPSVSAQWSASALDLKLKEADFHVYHFAAGASSGVLFTVVLSHPLTPLPPVWQCSPEEANRRVGAFYASDHFRRDGGIAPLPGAREALARLKGAGCRLVVVTSRQNAIRDVTHEWIDTHYAGLFSDGALKELIASIVENRSSRPPLSLSAAAPVLHGNHYSADGSPALPKSVLCAKVGAELLVDDNCVYAQECADAGIRVLHFNHQGRYPWSKGLPPHRLITPCESWEEVEAAALALARPLRGALADAAV